MPAVTFAGVTDVRIPEGNVVKITRKSDGVVLWERTKEYTFTVQAENAYGTDSKEYTVTIGKGA